MEKLQLPTGTTQDEERFYQQVFDNALGKIIDLDSVPTGDTLLAGQIGVNGTDVYLITPKGTKIKLSGSSWA
jgi:hypothetical protein